MATPVLTAEEKRELFYQMVRDETIASLKSKAMEGNIKEYPFRSVIWKAFFGIIDLSSSPDSWVVQMGIARDDYKTRFEKFQIDPYKLGQVSAVLNNPLSQDGESPWAQYFKNEEIQKEIMQDILRTYPDNEFFQQESIQKMLLNILFLHTRENPQVGYKQGMHELLAPIIYLVDREKSVCSGEDADPFVKITDENFVEADSASIFLKLMETCQAWFSVEESKRVITTPKASSAVKALDTQEQEVVSIVVRKCQRIHHYHLKSKDPELYAYAESLKIEPQLYALRWIRLLFGREFHIEDVLTLWDGIFSTDISSIVDYIAVAMLIYIRREVLGRDYMMTLKRLLKYPPVEDVTMFLKQAKLLRDPYYTPFQPASLAPGPTIQPPASQGSAKLLRSDSQKQAAPKPPPKSSTVSQVTPTKPISSNSTATQDIAPARDVPAKPSFNVGRKLPEAMNSSSPNTHQAGVVFGLRVCHSM
eukprot:TRINITY_DN6202_c0_g2_i3.p1 TRINITY_DN6202_c0_g2~~TRINITY_DN6202_c0_g2_i3.p1  ORF type:complete len:475 (+),score=97.61 TRINITY_DN6202_c0_g2_i3:52-1476(+)